MSSDTTVDWGRDFEHNWGEGDNRYFRKFWRNVVRWLAENSEASQARLRVETDKIIYHPGQDIRSRRGPTMTRSSETNSYRLVARLRSPDEPESRPFDESARALAPQPKDLAYRGILPAPQAAEILANAGSTLHTFILDVAAIEGDRIVATVERRPPNHRRSGRVSRPAAGPRHAPRAGKRHRRPRHPSPRRPRGSAGRHPDASVRLVVDRWPLWDNPLLWLLLLGFLASEWILRRRKGLA